jgi:hypothetical protein
MRKYINKLVTKAAPVIERAIKWAIRTAFELLKLASLAFMVMHVIVAAFVIEVALAAIVVFASLYFTKRSW